MAGTFYGIAQLNMKSQMRDQRDGAYPARVAQEYAYLSTPMAPSVGASNSGEGILARALRFLSRPAERKAAGSSTS